MQVVCQKCNSAISFEDTLPKFCSECGSSLSASGTLDATKVQPDTDKVDTRSMSDQLIGLDSQGDATIAPGSSGPVASSSSEGVGVGDQIGPYTLRRKLGQGGMGSVFEAIHQTTGQEVALKLLTCGNISANEESVQRFRRESQIAASINHPRSTFVYEAGQHNDQVYITMELMPGGTLQDVVDNEGAMPVNRAVDCILDMIEGLQVAHDAGIVHRDIKPSNSFVDNDGRTKVGDFGLAKSVVEDSSLTRTGMFMGTPQFAAPEQVKAGEIDERTDIYALGGTLFYLLAGRAPFVGNAAQVIASIASDTPAKVSEFANGIPRSLTRLISQTLEKDPNRRPHSLHMMRELLLPYSTSGAKPADIGPRMAAYFCDIVLAAFASGIAGLLWPLLIVALEKIGIDIPTFLATSIIQACAIISYFTISERFFGRTIGKWMFGLRVIDDHGEYPNLFQAFFRAVLITGIPYICNITVTSIAMDGFRMESAEDFIGLMLRSQAGSVFSWLAALVLFSTARKSNGYRGLHETFSGTRVVRLSGDVLANSLDRFEITAPVTLEESETASLDFSPYVVLGRFRHDENGESVYLGKDPELNRHVWIFDNVAKDSIHPTREHLKRPHRPRVISIERSGERTWYCTESNPGVPLVDVLDRPLCEWHSIRPILRDLAYELENAREQNLLPNNLTINLVWLDHTGRVRLLDHTLLDNTSTDSQILSPVDLLIKIIDRTFDHHSYPLHAITFRKELAARKNEPEILGWAEDQLAEMAETPSSWNWDDRIGMFAVSIGLEVSLISAAVFVCGFVASLFNLPTWTAGVLALAGGFGVVAAFAYLLHGGIAIRVSGVNVRRNKGLQRASRFRCVVRAIFGWSPWVAIVSSFAFMVLYEIDAEKTEIVNSAATFETADAIAAAGTAFSFLVFGLMLLGIAWAVFNPARNVQDIAAGTRLLRN